MFHGEIFAMGKAIRFFYHVLVFFSRTFQQREQEAFFLSPQVYPIWGITRKNSETAPLNGKLIFNNSERIVAF
jgi:hypothetical protein